MSATHEIEAPGTGTFRFVGVARTDEIYTGSAGLILNVSRLWKAIEEGSVASRKVRVRIDDGLLRALSQKDIDKERLARITAAEGAVPILLVVGADGCHQLVDGAHRLAWRVKQNLQAARAYIIQEEALRPYLVSVQFRALHSKRWKDMEAREVLDLIWGTYPEMDSAGHIAGVRRE